MLGNHNKQLGTVTVVIILIIVIIIVTQPSINVVRKSIFNLVCEWYHKEAIHFLVSIRSLTLGGCPFVDHLYSAIKSIIIVIYIY